jgi:hypothetical protein
VVRTYRSGQQIGKKKKEKVRTGVVISEVDGYGKAYTGHTGLPGSSIDEVVEGRFDPICTFFFGLFLPLRGW